LAPSGTLRLYLYAQGQSLSLLKVSPGAVFSHNNGTVILAPTYWNCSWISGVIDVDVSLDLYNLTVSGTQEIGCSPGVAAISSGDKLVVLNQYTQTSGQMTGTIDLKGNLVIGSQSIGGGGTVTLNGTVNQTISGTNAGTGPNIAIQKSAGTVTTTSTDLYVTSLAIIQGTYTAPSGTLALSFIAQNQTLPLLSVSTGQTFNHNNGTILANPRTWNCASVTGVFDVDATLTLNHLTINGVGGDGCGGARVQMAAGDSMTILGQLTMTDGMLMGTYSLKGDLVIGSAGNGGSAVVYMDSDVPQTITGASSGYGPNVVIQKTSFGVTTTSADLNLVSLSITQGAFTAPSGTLGLAFSAQGQTLPLLSISPGQTFHHNNGTILASPSTWNCSWVAGVFDVDSTLTINNLTINAAGGDGCGGARVQLATGDSMTILGTLNLNDGMLSGSYSLKGNLVIGSAANGGSASIALSGSAPQTISYSSGGTIPGISINATSTVSLLSNLIFGSGQNLTIASGTLNLAGFTLNVPDTLNLSPGSTMTLSGGAYTAGTLNNQGTIN
jgi:hypothetical protein